MRRCLNDLVVEPAENGLVLVDQWRRGANKPVEVLCCDRAEGGRCLEALQVTTRSPMGAIAHGTGGMLIDDGWVRVLGAGCARLPRSLSDWNGVGAAPRLADALLVGDDAIAGFFAVNGGRFGPQLGTVHYLAPNTLQWESLRLTYSQWLRWLFTGDLQTFYAAGRWEGWRDEVRGLAGDRAISVYPFLSAAGPPVSERSRRAVPIEELWGLLVDLRTGC